MDTETTPAAEVAARDDERASPAKLIRWAVALLVLIVAGWFGWRYWEHSQRYITTDNAYVNANRTEIAAQVSGPITAIHVRDQQHVRPGELLFEIDPQPYQIALDAAEAQLEIAYQSTSQESAAVAMARAQVAQRDAELRNAQSNERRMKDLIARKLISAQSAEAMTTQAETAAAAVRAAEANLAQAQSALGRAGEKNATVRAAAAKLAQAKLDLSHTKVMAPTSGLIANFDLRPGSTVQREVPLFTIIGDGEYWVDANFKETELERVQPGQQARVVVDMYRDHEFKGEVESLSAGSGQAFSLLPAQNASGNWVKVTQRVPVRVRIVDPDPNYPLRVGTTASVHVEAPESDH